MDLAIYTPYSGKILRTINFTVFKDFTAASKINSSKSFCITECYGNLVDPRNLSRKIYCGQITSKIFLPLKLPASYIGIFVTFSVQWGLLVGHSTLKIGELHCNPPFCGSLPSTLISVLVVFIKNYLQWQ